MGLAFHLERTSSSNTAYIIAGIHKNLQTLLWWNINITWQVELNMSSDVIWSLSGFLRCRTGWPWASAHSGGSHRQILSFVSSLLGRLVLTGCCTFMEVPGKEDAHCVFSARIGFVCFQELHIDLCRITWSWGHIGKWDSDNIQKGTYQDYITVNKQPD